VIVPEVASPLSQAAFASLFFPVIVEEEEEVGKVPEESVIVHLHV